VKTIKWDVTCCVCVSSEFISLYYVAFVLSCYFWISFLVVV